MKSQVVICAEAWSENLGDRVIAECMHGLLGTVSPQTNVTLLDLCGRPAPREQYHESAKPGRKLWRAFFRLVTSTRIIGRLLILTTWAVRHRWRLRKECARAFKRADLVIIGGGQLLADNQLAFPLRLDCVTSVAQSLRVPVVVLFCGVGENWSRVGAWLMRRALSRVAAVYVRDADSKRRLEALRLTSASVEVALDPGILASSYFNMERAKSIAGVKSIGLGIIAPQVINRHVSKDESRSPNGLARLWLDVVRELLRQGKHVEVFTNGALEDLLFARLVAEDIYQELGVKLNVSHPTTAHELVTLLSRFESVIAYRLHACIVAVSCGVPTVGLVWDDKVRAFFEAIDLPESVVLPDEQHSSAVVARLSVAKRVRADVLLGAQAKLVAAVTCALGYRSVRTPAHTPDRVTHNASMRGGT